MSRNAEFRQPAMPAKHLVQTLGAVELTTKTEPTPVIFWFRTRPAISATPWCRRWRLSWASRWHAEKFALTAPTAATPRCLLCCAKASLFLPQPRRERKIPPLARRSRLSLGGTTARRTPRRAGSCPARILPASLHVTNPAAVDSRSDKATGPSPGPPLLSPRRHLVYGPAVQR